MLTDIEQDSLIIHSGKVCALKGQAVIEIGEIVDAQVVESKDRLVMGARIEANGATSMIAIATALARGGGS